MNKPYFCQNIFLKDWRHKRLKKTIDLLLFDGEHFYGFSESVMTNHTTQCMYFTWYRLVLFFREFSSVIPFTEWFWDSSQIKGRV